VFALADMVHFLAHEFTRLRAGRLSFFLVAFRSSDDLLFWHLCTFRRNGCACCAHLKLARPCHQGNGLITLVGRESPCKQHQ